MLITVQETIYASPQKVWRMWTNPEDILMWCYASDDWIVTHAENDLRIGGTFSIGMASKDGTQGFDFEGMYTNLVAEEIIEYTMEDGRRVTVVFEAVDDGVRLSEIFDSENEHTEEEQRDGWQSILTNFKKYAEANVELRSLT
jgi:uncharacterized protein YndB with AHSA1/START domain